MKRTTLYISAALALAFALAGCTKDDSADGNRLPAGEYPVVIQATGLSVEAMPQTAASRATVDGDWEDVTSVALLIGGEVKEYTVTADAADAKSATLLRENDPFWWTSSEDITVSAWWPYDADNIVQMPAVVVLEDQSTLAAFQGSDFISAENRTVEFDNPTLEFFHRTARVAVKLTAGDGFSDSDIGEATVRLVSLSAANGNPTAIKTCNTSGNTHEALTAPQTVAAGNPFIEVNIGGDTFYFLPQNDVVLEAGNRHIYTIRVSASGLTLEGSTIGGWDEGNGEEGAAEELPGYTISVGGKTYTVYSAKGLLAWNEAALKDLSLNCTLTADITMPAVAEGESNWTPMGNYGNRYTGTFDGGGHTITGLTIYLPNQDCVGLIGSLNGKVQNLTLAEAKITGGVVGGVVGWNFGGTVTGCSVSGDVSGAGPVGGVAGANSGTVTGCYATGDVYGFIVGGVAGINSGTLTACYHEGTVSGSNYASGVVCESKNIVTACYWSNNRENDCAITGGGILEAKKVDGTDVTWEDAVDGMNIAIDKWNKSNPDNPCNWRYDETDAATPPVLIPAN